MKTITPADIAGAFHAAGAVPGDLVMLHSDIARIGPMAGAAGRQALLDGWVEGIRQAIGPDGTLVVLTASESYARHGTPFVYEETPSEQGVLSEHVRRLPGAVRSMHPLFSVTGLGPAAAEICGNAAPTGYGHDSPFDRLRERNCLVACVGVDLLAMSMVHHVEQRFGVPYGYTKEWTAPVLRNGRPVNERFFAFVRYLGAGVEYDFTQFQALLLERGLAKRAALGYGSVTAVRAADVFAVGVECLRKDIFFFLRQPPSSEPWKK